MVLPVVVLAADDLMRREVDVIWLAVFGVLAAVVAVAGNGIAGAAVNLAVNILVLLYIAGGILLYIKLRRGRWAWREYIGMGDVAFLVGVAPLWGVREFLLFLLAAAVFSLIWWAVARVRTIPFVATAGIVFIIALFL